jgi:drug/metabolite transporter (DMT)-like permease
MILVSAILALIATVLGQWSTLPSDQMLLLFASAVVGLAIGDAALFTAFARFGPRRTAVVFTTNAPMAAVIGAVVFDEPWTAGGILGTVLIVLGVVLAVVFGTRPGQTHRWEAITGNAAAAFGWALLGALGQAIGAIMVKPVFEAGAATWAVSASRVLIATPILWLLARPLDAVTGSTESAPLTPKLWWQLLVSSLLGMVIGMTLLLEAINTGDVGVATILSSTTPIMMLPLLWIATRERPAAGAWAGAALAVVGTALLV